MRNILTLQKIKIRLQRLKPFLRRKFKVKEIGVFGSYARLEASKRSDIDILVEFLEPIGWEFIDLKDILEKNLERNVDLVTTKALKPQLRDKILNEVVYA